MVTLNKTNCRSRNKNIFENISILQLNYYGDIGLFKKRMKHFLFAAVVAGCKMAAESAVEALRPQLTSIIKMAVNQLFDPVQVKHLKKDKIS